MMADQRFSISHSSVQPFRLLIDDNGPPPPPPPPSLPSCDPVIRMNLQQRSSQTEEGIRWLHSELLEVKKLSVEQMRKNIYARYDILIRTSEELNNLEMELASIQTLISTHSQLLHDIVDAGIHLQSVTSTADFTELHQNSERKEETMRTSNVIESQVRELLDTFDVSLAECRITEAMTALEEAEMLMVWCEEHEYQRVHAHADRAVYMRQQFSASRDLSERRSQLMLHLLKSVWALHHHGSMNADSHVVITSCEVHDELQKVVSLLKKLGQKPQAHTLLLRCYHLHIQTGIQNLSYSGCSWHEGSSYFINLARIYFSAILHVFHNSSQIFGNISEIASELVMWTCYEIGDYVSLVRKQVPLFTCEICAISDSIRISLEYCGVLEKQELFILSPLIFKLFKPFFEVVLTKWLNTAKEMLLAHCAADAWFLTDSVMMLSSDVVRSGHYGTMATPYVMLSSSAYKFYLVIQDLLGDVAPIMTTKLRSSIYKLISNIFGFYVKLLIKALPYANRIEVEGDSKLVLANTEPQQLVILGNATALAEAILPSSVFKEIHNSHQQWKLVARIKSTEQKDWNRSLQRNVDDLRDFICEQHVSQLFSDERFLMVDLYRKYNNVDGNQMNLDWLKKPMPSLPFQALHKKFHGLQNVAKIVLHGSERVIILLLMRLTHAFVMRLSKEKCFWGRIEKGSGTLSLFGLQQIATNGNYASRKMRETVSAMIARAKKAAVAVKSNLNGESVLHGDDWFEENARISLFKLCANFADSENMTM